MYVPVVAPYREIVPLAVVDSRLVRAHFGPGTAGAQVQVHVQPSVDHFDGVHAGLRTDEKKGRNAGNGPTARLRKGLPLRYGRERERTQIRHIKTYQRTGVNGRPNANERYHSSAFGTEFKRVAAG